MKRVLLSILTVMVVLLSFTTFCYAAGRVEESPDLKIEIDGKVSTYENVPILVNERTLLPFREVLVNLGVRNDKDHIIWNDKEQSVTVLDGINKVYLKIENTTAYVNGKPVTLDAAPVIYKERTYVPVRFVSQSLGKEVAWDGASKKVFIRSRDGYNKTKEILQKAFQATISVNKYKASQKLELSISKGSLAVGSRVEGTYWVDTKNKVLYHKSRAESILPNSEGSLAMSTEYYLDKNEMYTKNPLTLAWVKTTLPNDLVEKNLNIFRVFESQSILYSSMFADENSKTEEIVLSGKVCLSDIILPTLAGAKIQEYEVKDANLQVIIDRNTYFIKEISLDVLGNTVSLRDNPNWSIKLVNKNTDFNGTFEILNPVSK